MRLDYVEQVAHQVLHPVLPNVEDVETVRTVGGILELVHLCISVCTLLQYFTDNWYLAEDVTVIQASVLSDSRVKYHLLLSAEKSIQVEAERQIGRSDVDGRVKTNTCIRVEAEVVFAHVDQISQKQNITQDLVKNITDFQW